MPRLLRSALNQWTVVVLVWALAVQAMGLGLMPPARAGNGATSEICAAHAAGVEHRHPGGGDPRDHRLCCLACPGAAALPPVERAALVAPAYQDDAARVLRVPRSHAPAPPPHVRPSPRAPPSVA
ncbi:DUF2946 family protein [Chthonobacter rhizosphaerae]|uniref:DUF2946 family protein n=1 Tax=Chthonobacter rhizosphaerae TaxID=2735553 RepID=UPI0015EF3045|nr:DUF2946 family protein [Chthonobacter rhizosphaerae]